MPNYKLTYFDFDGGRGEPIRIALHAAGIDFDDERLAFPEFGARQPGLRFNAVPVFEVDGVPVTQSNGICRYVGRMAGLYPEDALQALYCDEALGAAEDVTNNVVTTFGLEGDALRDARKALVDGRLSVYLRGLNDMLVRGGGKYFANNALSVADLKIFMITRWLTSGALDHVPTDLVQRVAPELDAHRTRIAAEKCVVDYYASRPKKDD
jgi:glutathione S-transferase